MKISVLTPSYNSGKYLQRAIDSVLAQDYDNWEHIVMDGGSSDNTISILKSNPHITWRSEKDKGQADAMNKAFEISSGDVIVYLNADDYFEPNVFHKVIEAFNKSGCDMVVGNGYTIKADNLKHPWRPEAEYHKILLSFKYKFPYNPVSYFYKRKVQEAAGGFNLANHYTMDYEFLLGAYKNFRIKKIDTFLGTFFNDGDNKTSLINPREICKKTAITFCKKNDWPGLLYYYFSYRLFQLKIVAGRIWKAGKQAFSLREK